MQKRFQAALAQPNATRTQASEAELFIANKSQIQDSRPAISRDCAQRDSPQIVSAQTADCDDPHATPEQVSSNQLDERFFAYQKRDSKDGCHRPRDGNRAGRTNCQRAREQNKKPRSTLEGRSLRKVSAGHAGESGTTTREQQDVRPRFIHVIPSESVDRRQHDEPELPPRPCFQPPGERNKSQDQRW